MQLKSFAQVPWLSATLLLLSSFSLAAQSWAGSNLYYAAGLSTAEQHTLFSGLQAANIKVLRVWLDGQSSPAKGTSITSFPSLEPNAIGQYDDTVLNLLDSVMVNAKNYGIKLMISIHSFNALQANDVYGKWYGTGNFYTDSNAIAYFQQRIWHVLYHVNPHNGKAWKDCSEYIFAFEAQNEAMNNDVCPQSGTFYYILYLFPTLCLGYIDLIADSGYRPTFSLHKPPGNAPWPRLSSPLLAPAIMTFWSPPAVVAGSMSLCSRHISPALRSMSSQFMLTEWETFNTTNSHLTLLKPNSTGRSLLCKNGELVTSTRQIIDITQVRLSLRPNVPPTSSIRQTRSARRVSHGCIGRYCPTMTRTPTGTMGLGLETRCGVPLKVWQVEQLTIRPPLTFKLVAFERSCFHPVHDYGHNNSPQHYDWLSNYGPSVY
jgi:hypothetical protein